MYSLFQFVILLLLVTDLIMLWSGRILMLIRLSAVQGALLAALLEPTALMREAEYAGNLGKRMAMLDECKNLPLNAVWDYLCWKKNAGVGMSWLDEMDRYEREVQRKRV